MQSKNIDCVILLDVDGTLVTGADRDRVTAGVRAMARAGLEVTGAPVHFDGVDYAGRTDPQIAKMLIESTNGGRPSSENIQLLLEKYIQYLAEEIPMSPYRALGEPRLVVKELRRVGAVVGIGTGNLRPGAHLKLQSAGLGDLFDGQKGGYGEDGKTRADVLSYGARVCDPTGKLPVVVIGDTPRDVLAAHEIGGRCIGVPFGANDAKTLQNAGAEATAKAVDLSIVPLVRKLCRN